MKQIIKKGTTSKIVAIAIGDTSKADGSGLLALTYTAEGLDAYYIREGDATTTSIMLADMGIGQWVSGGLAEIGDGIYEFGIPDEVLLTGAEWAVIVIKGAENMASVRIEIELTGLSIEDGLVDIDTAQYNALAKEGTLTALDTVVDRIEGKVDVIDTNVDDIETTVGTIDGKVDVIDENVDDIETAVGTIDGKVDVIDENVTDIETMAAVLQTTANGIQTSIDNLDVDFDATDISNMVAGLLDATLTGHSVPGSVAVALANILSTYDPWTTEIGDYEQGSAGSILNAILAKLVTTAVTVASPVITSESVTIIQGDDYSQNDGREISWTEDSAGAWPNLSGATTKIYIGSFSKTGSVTTGNTGLRTISFELTSTETRALEAGSHIFWVKTTLASNRVITLLVGMMTVGDADTIVS